MIDSGLMGPLVVGALFTIGFDAWALLRPGGARLFLGFFFIAMGLGVNLTFLLTAPNMFAEYAGMSWWSAYQWLSGEVIGPYAEVFGVLLVAFEVTTGVLLLSRGRGVKVGLVASMLFVVALVPAHWMQLLWAGMLVGQAALLRRDFDESVIAMARRRFARKAEVA